MGESQGSNVVVYSLGRRWTAPFRWRPVYSTHKLTHFDRKRRRRCRLSFVVIVVVSFFFFFLSQSIRRPCVPYSRQKCVCLPDGVLFFLLVFFCAFETLANVRLYIPLLLSCLLDPKYCDALRRCFTHLLCVLLSPLVQVCVATAYHTIDTLENTLMGNDALQCHLSRCV